MALRLQVGGNLDPELLEGHAAVAVVGDARVAPLPGELVVGMDPFGGEVPPDADGGPLRGDGHDLVHLFSWFQRRPSRRVGLPHTPTTRCCGPLPGSHQMRWPLQHCSYGVSTAPGPVGPGPFAKVCTRLARGVVAPARAGRVPAVACVIAIDAGTTGVRALAVDESGAVVDVSYRELTQHFPRPGWVEHDPAEIWDSVVTTLAEVAGRLARGRHHRRRHRHHQPARDGGGLGPLERSSPAPGHRVAGPPHRRALRPAARRRDIFPWCASAPGSCSTPTSRAPRWSGCSDRAGSRSPTTSCWPRSTPGCLEPHGRHRRRGARHRRHQRLAHLALRHPDAARGPTSCAELFGVPRSALPEVRPSCGRFGVVAGALAEQRPVARRRPRERRGRRPAGGAVRPGVHSPGHGQGDLRDGELRAAERR